MTLRYQVCCVMRSDRVNHDRRLLGIGGVNRDGARWKISEASAIAGIERGQWRFYLSRDGQEIEIVVATSKYGGQYLKAADDRGLHPETLLALPECR